MWMAWLMQHACSPDSNANCAGCEWMFFHHKLVQRECCQSHQESIIRYPVKRTGLFVQLTANQNVHRIWRTVEHASTYITYQNMAIGCLPLHRKHVQESLLWRWNYPRLDKECSHQPRSQAAIEMAGCIQWSSIYTIRPTVIRPTLQNIINEHYKHED